MQGCRTRMFTRNPRCFAMSSSSAVARRASPRRWRPGGQGVSEGKVIDTAALEAAENITVLTRTTVFGVYDGGTYGAIERLTDHLPSSAAPRQRFVKIIAARSVLASGAIERPLQFGAN